MRIKIKKKVLLKLSFELYYIIIINKNIQIMFLLRIKNIVLVIMCKKIKHLKKKSYKFKPFLFILLIN